MVLDEGTLWAKIFILSLISEHLSILMHSLIIQFKHSDQKPRL